MEYLQELIKQTFINVAEIKDGYFEQEDRIVARVLKPEKVPYMTNLVDTLYTSMNNYLRMMEGQLFNERLHEVI